MTTAPAHEPEASTRRHALLRHEWEIASAGLRAIFRKPLDRLTVLIAVPACLLVVRAWVSRQPEQLLELHAFAVGFLVPFYCVKALAGRCTYHRTDGILSAHAQRTRELLAFALPLFIAAVAMGLAYLIIVNAFRPTLWLAATAAGATASWVWAHVSRIVRKRQPIFLRWLRPRHSRKHSGAMAILVAVGALLGTACAILPLQVPAIAFATVAISLAVTVVLGRVDAAAIRYRTMVGHSSWTIVRSHILPLSAVFAPFAATLTLAPHWAPAALAAILGLAVTAFVAMRILAYQSFHRRIADWVVTVLIAISALVGLALPPAAPVALLFGVVWLARRAASQTWLIG